MSTIATTNTIALSEFVIAVLTTNPTWFQLEEAPDFKTNVELKTGRVITTNQLERAHYALKREVDRDTNNLVQGMAFSGGIFQNLGGDNETLKSFCVENGFTLIKKGKGFALCDPSVFVLAAYAATQKGASNTTPRGVQPTIPLFNALASMNPELVSDIENGTYVSRNGDTSPYSDKQLTSSGTKAYPAYQVLCGILGIDPESRGTTSTVVDYAISHMILTKLGLDTTTLDKAISTQQTEDPKDFIDELRGHVKLTNVSHETPEYDVSCETPDNMEDDNDFIYEEEEEEDTMDFPEDF